ncbi:MAG: M23 family metallopeptidase [Solirubrobacterales bacterium]
MAKPGHLASLVVAAAILAAAPGARAADFSVEKASVSPRKAFLGARGGVRIEFRIAAAAPADVSIRIFGEGREVRRIDLEDVAPDTRQVETWDGLTSSGAPAPDGVHRVLIGPPDEDGKQVGKLTLFGHFFPVRGPHGTRGPGGEFGAARNGGRIHSGFDVTARCGTPLAAARAGTVVKRTFDPRLDGNFVVIRGLGERRKYQYSHMVRPSPFQQGDEVHPGDIVGHIGRTGNAASTPCHLHFEIHLRGHPIDPEPALRAWDRFS